jgi:hypothetical protein
MRKHLGVLFLFLICLATGTVGMGTAHADLVWNLQPGSTFFDANTNLTQALTGTITTETIDYSDTAPFSTSGWTYVRQQITGINISGNTVVLQPSSIGGGAIDITNEGYGTFYVAQVQIIVQDGIIVPDQTRFTGYSPGYTASFTGTAYAPTSFTLVDLEGVLFLGGSGTIDTGDSMTLLLSLAQQATGTVVPAPAAILLFAPGLVGLAAIRRRFKA